MGGLGFGPPPPFFVKPCHQLLLNVFVCFLCVDLKATDYGWLCERLRPCAAKWKLIAQSLRFTHDEILTIEAHRNNEGPTSCLDNVIGDWLQWAPGDARGSEHYASLELLKDAVSKAGYGAIAVKLTEGRCIVMGCTKFTKLKVQQYGLICMRL